MTVSTPTRAKSDPFEYDVFLSVASSDEKIVRPFWQALCSSGLRVFWSDSTLKIKLGESWFETIQSSLERSKHFVLICSELSMSSEWVRREYVAFFNHCYKPGVRCLIPILIRNFDPSTLPILLREIEACRLNTPDSIIRIIQALGGVSLEELREEISVKEEEIKRLNQTITVKEEEIGRLNQTITILKSELGALRQEAQSGERVCSESKGWKRSSPFGGSGGVSFFDDLTEVVKMNGFEIHCGRYVDGIKACWQMVDGSKKWGNWHGGKGGGGPIITLDDDEQITRVEGRSGEFVDRLTFYTNKKIYGPFGGDGGQNWEIDIRSLTGFFGRSWNYLDQVGFFYSP